jgi:hypothetical protein
MPLSLRHDVAASNVKVNKDVVGQGYPASINVTVQNQGAYAETFNVTVYANSTAIGTQTINNLASLGQVVLTLPWNTSGFAKGNYTIWAYAWPIPGETDLADNTCTDGTVRVVIPGDVVPEFGYVGIDDIFDIATHFGCEYPSKWHPPQDPIRDITNDDHVGIDDIFIAASHFGQEDP